MNTIITVIKIELIIDAIIELMDIDTILSINMIKENINIINIYRLFLKKATITTSVYLHNYITNLRKNVFKCG